MIAVHGGAVQRAAGGARDGASTQPRQGAGDSTTALRAGMVSVTLPTPDTGTSGPPRASFNGVADEKPSWAPSTVRIWGLAERVRPTMTAFPGAIFRPMTRVSSSTDRVV